MECTWGPLPLTLPAWRGTIGYPVRLMLKFLVSLATAVILLPIIAVLVFFFVINPNRYHDSLQSLAFEQTGLEINIAGNISWTFRPTLGLSLSDVRIVDNDARRELASIRLISFSVAPRDLLQGNLVLQEMRIDGLHVNWFTDAEGKSNWSLPLSYNTQISTADPLADNDNGEVSNPRIDPILNQIVISNATIDIQNVQRNYHISLEKLNLTASNSNTRNIQFPIDANFLFLNHTGEQALKLTVGSRARVDYLTGNAQFDSLRINLSPMELQGSFSIRNFRHEPIWFSSLSSNTFILSDLLDNFRQPEVEQNTPLVVPSFPVAEIGQTSVQIKFNGDRQTIAVSEFQLTIDEMRIDSDASLRYATNSSSTNLSYRITSNALDLRPWFETDDEDNLVQGTANTNSAAGLSSTSNQTNNNAGAHGLVDGFEIPRDFLTSINIQGSHNIESLLIGKLELADINVFINLEDGILNLETQPIEMYGGTILSTFQLDSRSNTALLTSQISTTDINLSDLLSGYPKLQTLRGRLDLVSSWSMRGNTLDTLLDTISGHSTFNLKQNTIDIGIPKQVFTAISALSPTGDAIQEWPDIIQFRELSGYLLLRDGFDENQQVKIRMDNFDMEGSGGVNLVDETFNFDFLFTVLGEPFPQTIQINQSYHNASWPVLCAAEFSSVTNQYCRPDFPNVRALFLQLQNDQPQISQGQIENKFTSGIPDEIQDAARALLINFQP